MGLAYRLITGLKPGVNEMTLEKPFCMWIVDGFAS